MIINEKIHQPTKGQYAKAMKRILTVFCLLIGLFASPLLAQEIDISRVPLRYKENPSFIAGMTQDKRGYIWFADNNRGLFRFDGINLVQFKNQPGNFNSLVSDRLECIVSSADGSIWIGSFSSGLVHFDPVEETFKTYMHDANDPKSIRANNIRALAVDSLGGVWIGTSTGLDYFNPADGEFKHRFTEDPDEDQLQQEHVRSLYVDKKGTIWVGCGSAFIVEPTVGGLFSIDINNGNVDRYLHNSNENSLIDNRVKAIFEDSKGNFWVGTAGDGLHTMDRENGTFVRHRYDPSHPEKLSRPPLGYSYQFAQDHIVSISEDLQGYIWIATFQGGVNRYDPGSGKVQHFGNNEQDPNYIPRNDIWCSLVTRDGLIWMSSWEHETYDDQLIKINPNSYKIENISLGMQVVSFTEDRSGNIYMGSTTQVLKMDTAGSIEKLMDLPLIPGGNRSKVFVDPNDDKLWIASLTGLYIYNLLDNQITRYHSGQTNGLESNQITEVALLNKDSILVGADPGLYLLDLTSNMFKKLAINDLKTGLPVDARINKILIDQKKNIWIGVQSHGLQKLDIGSGRLISYPFRKVDAENIFDISEDPEGGLLVSSWRSGLRWYNAENDRFENMTDETGLLGEETIVFSVYYEGEDIYWLETPDGIIRHNSRAKTSSVYGISWGINISETTANGFFISSDGYLYKGIRTGYFRFAPENFRIKTETKSPLFIGKILVNNTMMDYDPKSVNGIELTHDRNNMALQLDYINYLKDPDDKQYMQYQLEGYDNVWRNGESGEMVYYNWIPPGKYTFRLKAMDLYGAWDEVTLKVLVSPPWYGTVWAYISYGLLFIAGVFATDRIQRRRLINKERAMTREKELRQAREIEKAYNELKTTQAQLVQSEKMASLGELTAGIAHEIQNPLNFVNNFSEVNAELIEEAEAELINGNTKEVSNLLKDLKENELKISQHGKRADGIVKNMLQHSRTSAGEKELTDLNALCDEYVRLAYHGMRAKDKDFNAEFKLELDETLPKVNVVPQDMGRVLLNLINNAFYAVAQSSKLEARSKDYQPEVKVSTAIVPLSEGVKGEEKIEIRVKDNGPGIPDHIREKIFQPFFTTKPTGQGTGLGLSLSYDIITKGHGGMISVKSERDRGTEFVIQIPV